LDYIIIRSAQTDKQGIHMISASYISDLCYKFIIMKSKLMLD